MILPSNLRADVLSPYRFLGRFRRRLLRRQQHGDTVRSLHRLSDSQLRDIGLRRTEVDHALAEPARKRRG